MFLYYILFVISMVILIILFKKRTLILFISSIFVLALLEHFNFFDFSVTTLDIFKSIATNINVIFLLLSITFLYLISELVIILGLHHSFENFIERLKFRNQKIFVLLFSSFGSIIDLKNIVVLQKFKKIYNQSITLTKSLNMFSADMITVLLILLIINSTFAPKIYLLLIATNFFAIFFIFKRIIDFKTDTYIDYKVHTDRLNELQNATINRNIVYPYGRSLFIRVLVYILVPISLIFFISINLYTYIFIVVSIIFIDLLISSIIYSTNSKDVDELFIYKSLFGAMKNIIKPVMFALVSLIFIDVVFDALYGKMFILNFGINNVVLILFILGILTSYILSDALLGFIVILPIFSIYSMSSFFDYNSQSFIYMMFGLIFFSNFLSVLKITNRTFIVYFDLFYMFLVGITCYVFYYFTTSLVYSYLLLSIFIVLYYFISMFYRRSSKL